MDLDLDEDDSEHAQSLTASSSGNFAGDSVKSISGNTTSIKEPSNKRNKRTYPTELSEMSTDGDECEKRRCQEILAENRDYQVKMEELSAENEALKLKLVEKETNASASEQCEEKSDSISLSANGPIVSARAFARCFYRRKRGTKFEYVICVFRLCSDVLGDLFQFATRRQLSSLEPIGRQFHNVIVNRFTKKPFLSLSTRIIFSEPVQCEGWNYRSPDFPQILSEPGVLAPLENITDDSKVTGLLVIGKNEERETFFLHDANFSNLPPYLRIEKVEVLGYEIKTFEVFEEGIQLISPLILQLKTALIGSKLDVDLRIDDILPDLSNKYTWTSIREDLERLVQLFDCCKHYHLSFDCGFVEGSDLIALLLQHPSIGSNVFINITSPIPRDETTLPIEAISNWLHKQAVKSLKKMEEKRSLHLDCGNYRNMLEMVDHLKETFSTAQQPVQPFYFRLSGDSSFNHVPDSIVDEKILNQVSCEELSIRLPHWKEHDWYHDWLIIERKRIQK